MDGEVILITLTRAAGDRQDDSEKPLELDPR